MESLERWPEPRRDGTAAGSGRGGAEELPRPVAAARRLIMGLLACSLAALAGPLTAAAQAPQPLPIPSAAEQAASTKRVRAEYRERYRGRTVESQQFLARKLLDRATARPDVAAAERFVMLREARDAAVRAGEVAVAIECAERLAAAFAVAGGPVGARLTVVSALAHAKLLPHEARAAARAADRLIDDAIRADDYAAALKAAAALGTLAKQSSAAPLARQQDELGAHDHPVGQRARGPGRRRVRMPNLRAAGQACGGAATIKPGGDWAAGLQLLAGGGDGDTARLPCA